MLLLRTPSMGSCKVSGKWIKSLKEINRYDKYAVQLPCMGGASRHLRARNCLEAFPHRIAERGLVPVQSPRSSVNLRALDRSPREGDESEMNRSSGWSG
jgi:hypothetical protein